MRFLNRPGFRNSSSDHTFWYSRNWNEWMKAMNKWKLEDWLTDRLLTDFTGWQIDWLTTDWQTEWLCWQWKWRVLNDRQYYLLLFCSHCFFFSFISTNLYDDTWQHVRLTWENTQGVAKLYKDGQFAGQVTNNATENFTLTAGGFLVLVQDQDSIGGGFIRRQTLRGRSVSVNMWDKVLSESDIAAQYTNCSVPYGSVLNWSVFKNLTHGNVTVEEPWSKLFRDQTL